MSVYWHNVVIYLMGTGFALAALGLVGGVASFCVSFDDDAWDRPRLWPIVLLIVLCLMVVALTGAWLETYA